MKSLTDYYLLNYLINAVNAQGARSTLTLALWANSVYGVYVYFTHPLMFNEVSRHCLHMRIVIGMFLKLDNFFFIFKYKTVKIEYLEIDTLL